MLNVLLLKAKGGVESFKIFHSRGWKHKNRVGSKHLRHIYSGNTGLLQSSALAYEHARQLNSSVGRITDFSCDFTDHIFFNHNFL